MKKFMAVLAVVFLAACVSGPVSVASKKTGVTPENLHLFKGAWVGHRSWETPGRPARFLKTELRVENDCIPLDAALIFHETSEGSKKNSLKNAVIEDGKLLLVFKNSNGWISLNLPVNGKIKGKYKMQYGPYELEGDINLKKIN